MNRFWAILFLLVPIAAIGSYILAAYGIAPLNDAWMPENYNEAGKTIDGLFNGLHYLSAVILIGTLLTIVWIIWKFDETRNKKALHVHTNTKLEVTWSIIPAFILVFIAIYQMNSWAENKMDRPTIEVGGESVPKPPLVLVVAKQFGWEFHYAGEDSRIQTEDDIYIENELVVPVNEEVVLQLESRDVIHSFFVPELRLKQDIVPGMRQFAWFNATREGEMQVICAELCGWGHYKMISKMRIVSRAEFDEWLSGKALEYSAIPANEQVKP